MDWFWPSGSSVTMNVERFERETTSVWTFRLPCRVGFAFGIFAASSFASSGLGFSMTLRCTRQPEKHLRHSARLPFRLVEPRDLTGRRIPPPLARDEPAVTGPLARPSSVGAKGGDPHAHQALHPRRQHRHRGGNGEFPRERRPLRRRFSRNTKSSDRGSSCVCRLRDGQPAQHRLRSLGGRLDCLCARTAGAPASARAAASSGRSASRSTSARSRRQAPRSLKASVRVASRTASSAVASASPKAPPRASSLARVLRQAH